MWLTKEQNGYKYKADFLDLFHQCLNRIIDHFSLSPLQKSCLLTQSSRIIKNSIERRVAEICLQALNQVETNCKDASLILLQNVDYPFEPTRIRNDFQGACKRIYDDALKCFNESYNLVDFGSRQNVKEKHRQAHEASFCKLAQELLTHVFTQFSIITDNGAVIIPESQPNSPQKSQSSDSSKTIVDVSGEQKNRSFEEWVNKNAVPPPSFSE